MTEQQILLKLTGICSKAEYCKYDMVRKMTRWEVAEDLQEKVLEYLVSEGFIDETRFARAFIRAKKEYNHWGVKKIENALFAKRIPRDIYDPILKEICNNDYHDILKSLLQNKKRSVKASSDYELKGKLIRFAMQRGFTYDQISEILDEL